MKIEGRTFRGHVGVIVFLTGACSPAQQQAWMNATPACVQCAADILAASQTKAKAPETCASSRDAGTD